MSATKPYTVGWPFTAEQARRVDRMFELLFQANETRDPNAHATTHEEGGSDEVELTEAQITNLVSDLAAIAAALALLTPLTRTLTAGAGLTGGGDLSANRTFDVGAGTGVQVNANDVEVKYGAIAGTACQGNDSRLSDARTPTAHATSHQDGGGDEVATTTPASGAIPKANSSGFLPAGFVHDEKTFTSTGNVDDLDVGSAPSVLVRFNNASLTTLRGMIPGCVNQRVIIVSVGAGQVDLSHQDTNESTAARRLINIATSGATSLAPGSGSAIYVYDETTDRWRLVQHEQGDSIAYTPTWAGGSPAPSIGDGSLTGRYYLRGKQVTFSIHLGAGSTTTFGDTTSGWTMTLPLTSTGAFEYAFPVYAFQSGVAHHIGVAMNRAAADKISFYNEGNSGNGYASTNPWTWQNGDDVEVGGVYFTT